MPILLKLEKLSFRFFDKRVNILKLINNKDCKELFELCKIDAYNLTIVVTFFKDFPTNEENKFSIKRLDRSINLMRNRYKSLSEEQTTKNIDIVFCFLKNKILSLTSDAYSNFRADFLEYIILYSKNTLGKHQKKYCEPKLFYKRKELLKNRFHKEIRVDTIIFNTKNRTINFIESKSNLSHFLYSLADSYKSGGTKKNHQKKARKKYEYLKDMYDVFQNKFETCNCGIAFATYQTNIKNVEILEKYFQIIDGKKIKALKL